MWSELGAEAMRALFAHGLRTTLSIAGVAGAVATVVTSAAIVQGGREQALDQMRALGERNLIVRGRAAGSAPREGTKTISLTDLRAIAAGMPGVRAVAAVRSSRLDLVRSDARIPGVVVGVTDNWPAVSETRLAAGRWLTRADGDRRSRVMVLGARAAERLGGGTLAIGQYVKAGDEWFVVVGVLARRTRSAGAVQRFDADEAALVPLSAATRRLGADDGPDRAEEVVLAFDSADQVVRAAPHVTGRLREIGSPSAVDGVEVLVPRELFRARLATRHNFDVMLLAIGAISLVISSLAIMNIMLVSVAERTHEIGMRRACGARRSDILRQFALEAGVLTVVGAVAGTGLGIVVCALLASTGWVVQVNGHAMVRAWALVAVAGSMCSLYPARRAAALTPCEALRVR